MNIKYHTTAYVQCSRKLLDLISTEVSGWATGHDTVCLTTEDLADGLDDTSALFTDTGVRSFLKSVLKQASGKAGDIIFHL